MGLPATETIPLEENADGILRVSGTRVTLDTIIYAFQDGATPEEIVQQYSSLSLADVYHVIGYYLRNRLGVEKYLQKREQEQLKVRQQNENLFDPQGIRDRLLNRRIENEKDASISG